MTASIEAQSKSQTNSADNVADSVKRLEAGSRGSNQSTTTQRSRATSKSKAASKTFDRDGTREKSDRGSQDGSGSAVTAQGTIHPEESVSNKSSRAGSVTPSMKSDHPRLDSEERVRTRDKERGRTSHSLRERPSDNERGRTSEEEQKQAKTKIHATSLASDWSMPVSTREGTKVLKGSGPVEMLIRISPAEGDGKGT